MPDLIRPRVPHVWVKLDYVPELLAGLVTEWERRDDGWWALVTYGWNGVVYTQWLSSAHVSPHRSSKYTGTAHG